LIAELIAESGMCLIASPKGVVKRVFAC